LPANSNNRWENLLPVHRIPVDSAIGADYIAGKTVLLTGAGGSIGSALAIKILDAKPRSLLLLDRSEQALYELGRSLSCRERMPAYHLVPGDVGDRFLVSALIEEHSPDLVLHAAAFKHVPLMEANPFAAVHNNAIDTWQLAKAAAQAGVPQFLLISTDKAANPRSILGVSKRIAEQAVLRWSEMLPRYAALRLVNVLGSTGSVVPLFLEQIARGGPLTVTHPDAARHFMTLEDTVNLILTAAALPGRGVVYVPEVSEPMRIVDIARALLRHDAGETEEAIPIQFTGLRPGDKLDEELSSTGESLRPTSHPAIHQIAARSIFAGAFDQAILQLSEIVKRRDLAALLEAVCRLVPNYEPGPSLCPDRLLAHD
jgi:FlaA1/EpsC-like NDP-sugar epimerase